MYRTRKNSCDVNYIEYVPLESRYTRFLYTKTIISKRWASKNIRAGFKIIRDSLPEKTWEWPRRWAGRHGVTRGLRSRGSGFFTPERGIFVQKRENLIQKYNIKFKPKSGGFGPKSGEKVAEPKKSKLKQGFIITWVYTRG